MVSHSDSDEQIMPNENSNPMTKEEMMKNSSSGQEVALQDWGYPGYLSDDEFVIFVSLMFLLVTSS